MSNYYIKLTNKKYILYITLIILTITVFALLSSNTFATNKHNKLSNSCTTQCYTTWYGATNEFGTINKYDPKTGEYINSIDSKQHVLTANGDIFSPKRLTAASNTIPLGTFIKVTNILNNKSIIVKINDNGIHNSQSKLDLSAGAFWSINNNLCDGVIKTNIQQVNKEDYKINNTNATFHDIEFPKDCA